MNHRTSETKRGAGLNGWSIAAALGLMAAAFLIERIAPAEVEERPKSAAGDLPATSNAKRDASAASLATEAEDRGRHATSPDEIPARGWKDILYRVYANIGNHRVLALAAGMTYYCILAIFPALAALVAIYGMFTDPGSIAKHLNDMHRVFARRVAELDVDEWSPGNEGTSSSAAYADAQAA